MSRRDRTANTHANAFQPWLTPDLLTERNPGTPSREVLGQRAAHTRGPQLYAPAETRYGGAKRSGRNEMSDQDEEHRPVRRVLWARLLLILPFVSMLWVSSYNTVEPMLAGIPFFYWYQLLWVLIAAALIAIVYAVER
jgi:hypothetical protein